MEFMISISRPGKSWNFSEDHGKSWKSNMVFLICKIKRQKDKKFEKITDESETGFNFSRNKGKPIFYAITILENMVLHVNYCFDTTVRTNA